MLVSLVTPTNIYEPAFALLEKYMQRQTYTGDIIWIIIDDSVKNKESFIEKKIGPRLTQRIYKSPQLWEPGFNTQRICLNEAIKYIPKETTYVLLPEYDDWFREDYIETMIFFLQKFPLVGQSTSRYYAVKDRSYKLWTNYNHCSLTETGFRFELLNLFARAVNSGELFIDGAIWSIARTEKVNMLIFNHIGLACGIKQVGTLRSGIGAGHTPKDQGFTKDPFFEKLKEWIGPEDSKAYQAWGRS